MTQKFAELLELREAFNASGDHNTQRALSARMTDLRKELAVPPDGERVPLYAGDAMKFARELKATGIEYHFEDDPREFFPELTSRMLDHVILQLSSVELEALFVAALELDGITVPPQ